MESLQLLSPEFSEADKHAATTYYEEMSQKDEAAYCRILENNPHLEGRYAQKYGIGMYKDQSREAFSRWLDGNYNPEDQTYTFYRFVGSNEAATVERDGYLPSRMVSLLGAGCLDLTRRNLTDISAGRLSDAVHEAFYQFMKSNANTYELAKSGQFENLIAGHMLGQLAVAEQVVYDGDIPEDLQAMAQTKLARLHLYEQNPQHPDLVHQIRSNWNDGGFGSYEIASMFQDEFCFTTRPQLKLYDTTHRLTYKACKPDIIRMYDVLAGDTVGQYGPYCDEDEWRAVVELRPELGQPIVVEELPNAVHC